MKYTVAEARVKITVKNRNTIVSMLMKAILKVFSAYKTTVDI